MDDGGGAMIPWRAFSLVKQLGLRPKRTMRAVLWTAEEQGLVGSQQYYEKHKANASNYDLVMESDIGMFTPTGIQFTGTPETYSIMKEVVQVLVAINASNLKTPADGGDVGLWIQDGVPGGSLTNENDRYFYFHHSNGDTMTVQDSHQMDLCPTLWRIWRTCYPGTKLTRDTIPCIVLSSLNLLSFSRLFIASKNWHISLIYMQILRN